MRNRHPPMFPVELSWEDLRGVFHNGHNGHFIMDTFAHNGHFW